MLSVRCIACYERAVRAQTEICTLVGRYGETNVGCEQLALLCPDYVSVSEQFMRVAESAHKEDWSFTFLPDGAVRFGALDTRDA